ncbi:MAG: MFS transporter [Actinobacteria bacterium]|nr:MFS transporter [Actinomycetota bacterium]
MSHQGSPARQRTIASPSRRLLCCRSHSRSISPHSTGQNRRAPVSSWFQSVNSLFILALAPLFAWLWVRLRERQPSIPMKFVWGLVFLGLSFALLVPAAQLTAAGKVSPWWLIAVYFLQTVGELCLSPVGLSAMTKLAPAKLTGLVMGIWFLGTALGNKLAGVVAGEFNGKDPQALAHFFWQQALLVAGMTVLLLVLVPWVRRLTGEHRHADE